MDFKQIQSIIKNFEKSTMTNLEIETEEIKLKLSKLNELRPTVVEVKEPTKVSVETKSENEANGIEIKSPLVGTYYESDNPNGTPFVKVGDQVAEGDTLCIIEAMKIMNEITAPKAGVVESISVLNGAAVGFDQVLMVIK